MIPIQHVTIYFSRVVDLCRSSIKFERIRASSEDYLHVPSCSLVRYPGSHLHTVTLTKIEGLIGGV